MIRISDFTDKWKHLQDKNIFLACSGGVDSMVLLHLLSGLSNKVTVLHINYQLRGEDSDLDEKLVRETCLQYEKAYLVKRIETKNILSRTGGNLQDFARKIRYNWFAEIIAENENNVIILGHHQDDQVETFFQHIARKSGIMGMAGMLENHNHILRPLLSHSKEEIYAFARANGIVWREDISNEGNDYTRNKLRNILIPEVEKEIPDLKTSVLTLVKAFQETQKIMEAKVKHLVDQIHQVGTWGLSDFDACSEEEKAEILRQLGIRQTFIAELNKIRFAQKGKKITADGFEIVREAAAFHLVKAESNKRFHLKVEKVVELPTVFDQQVIYLDAAKIKGELKLRKWQQGDRMRPIGLNGSKLISDILTAAKVLTSSRNEALILEDEEKIIWCVGIKISSLAIATSESVRILKVSVEQQ